MAFCGRAVIETVAGGDPDRLRRLAVRFSRPVLPGESITVRIHRAGEGAFGFEALNAEGRAVVKDGRASSTHEPMSPRLRLFARAREAAGRGVDEIEAQTLGELLDRATASYGPEFVAVLACSRVWVNGLEPTGGRDTPVGPSDEVAVLPPVSGGS